MKERLQNWMICLLVLFCVCCGVIKNAGIVQAEETETTVVIQQPVITSVENTVKGIKISWEKIPGMKGYHIYRDDEKIGRVFSSSGKFYYVDQKPGEVGSSHVYSVVAFKKVDGVYHYSEKSAGKTMIYMKTAITSGTNTINSIKLKWDKVPNAGGYVVYRNGVKIATVKGAANASYEDKNPGANGTRYVYRVAAYKKIDGKYHYSAKTAGKVMYFMKCNHISTAVRQGNTTTVTWNKNSKASGYQIQYSTSSKFSSAKTVTISGTSKLQWKTDILLPSKTYYLRIRTYKKSTTGYTYSAWNPCAKIIAFNSKWQFAGNSKICTGSATLYYVNPDAANKKNKIVCINAGHGTIGGSNVYTLCHPDGSAKVTGGSTAAGSYTATAVSTGTDMLDGTAEGTVTLALAMKVKEKLLSAGYNVLMIREASDVQLDNVARTVLANNNADCHIALHYDSSSNDKGAFYISVPSVSSYRNMYPVSSCWQLHNSLGENVVAGMKEAGVKIFSSGSMELDLTQTSYSTIPSIDLEVGDRGSSRSDATFTNIANGIVKGVDSFF